MLFQCLFKIIVVIVRFITFYQSILRNCKSFKVFSPWSTCDALRNLVPFVQFKKCEKHLWKSVSFKSLQLY